MCEGHYPADMVLRNTNRSHICKRTYKMFRIIMGDAQKELLSAATTGTVYLRHISKDIKTIKKTETTMGQNETLIEYAKDNSKQNKTVLIP